MATFVRTQQISHSIGPDGSLDLRVRSADVRVRTIDAPEARVIGTFEIRAPSDDEADRIFGENELRVERTDGSLRVVEDDGQPVLAGALNRLFGGGHHLDLSVEVEVPVDARLHIATVSGDVQASGLHGPQRYQTVSGDLFLTDLGGTVRVNTISGDATIRASEPLDVRSEAVSGDLNVAAPLLRGLVASAVSGDLGIEGELSPAGEFRVETVSGDLSLGLIGSVAFDVRGLSTDISSNIDHRVEGRLDRRRVVIGSGGPGFLFKSMSGDLSIRRPRRTERWTGPTPKPAPAAKPSPSEQLDALRALESGEIDIEEAMRRLGEGSTDA
jgi:hypothetical protein